MPERLVAMLPPTADDLALAAEVNRKLPPHAQVTLYRVETGDDMLIYAMIYEYYSARKPISRAYPFYDSDEVVKDVLLWIETLTHEHVQRWSLTPT